MLRKAYMGFGLVTLTSVAGLGAYGYRRSQNAKFNVEDFNQESAPILNKMLVQPSTKLNAEERKKACMHTLSGLNLDLYAFHHCPFCSRVEMFLHVNKIPFKKTYVNRITKHQVSTHNYKKVPQLLFKDNQNNTAIMGDCSLIVTQLASYLGMNVGKEYPEVEKWRTWSSDVLARFVVLEVNDDYSENVKFLYSTPGLTMFERVFFVMASPFLKLVVHPLTSKNLIKLGKDPNEPRKGLHSELYAWVHDGIKNNEFHGGDKPDVCDTDVYGVLFGIKRHPMYERIKESDVKVAQWMVRMEQLAPKDD